MQINLSFQRQYLFNFPVCCVKMSNGKIWGEMNNMEVR